MQYMTLENVAKLPGVVVRDGVAYGEMCGRYFPVKSVIYSFAAKNYVPVLDIPMMSDERWAELAREQNARAGK